MLKGDDKWLSIHYGDPIVPYKIYEQSWEEARITIFRTILEIAGGPKDPLQDASIRSYTDRDLIYLFSSSFGINLPAKYLDNRFIVEWAKFLKQEINLSEWVGGIIERFALASNRYEAIVSDIYLSPDNIILSRDRSGLSPTSYLS